MSSGYQLTRVGCHGAIVFTIVWTSWQFTWLVGSEFLRSTQNLGPAGVGDLLQPADIFSGRGTPIAPRELSDLADSSVPPALDRVLHL